MASVDKPRISRHLRPLTERGGEKGRLAACLALGLLLLGPALALAELPELIPLEVLFGNPSQTRARISPDGTKLSYIAPSEEDVLNVWVRDLDGGEPEMVTQDGDRGIRFYFWDEEGHRLFYLQDIGGDENWHLYAVELESKLVRDLTPFQGIRADNMISDRQHPHEMLVGLNLRDRRLFDMYRVDLKTGGLTLDTENPGDVGGWLTDPEFVIRAAIAQNPADGSTILRVRDGKEKPWRELVTWPFGENGFPHDFSADGKSLFVETSIGGDTTRLVRIDVATGEELEVLASHPKSDVGAVVVHPDTHVVQAVEFEYTEPEWRVLDDAIRADVEFLERAHEGHFGAVSRDRADAKWIVYYEVDDGPLSYHLYDRAAKKLELLFVDRPELLDYRLAERKPLILEARDGLELVSYLTLPPGLEPKGLPMVLLVHGGPWARDNWGYDAQAQWLANRGYAVLQVNFRASTGFGKAFLNAGNEQWGQGTMQHDLTDAVKWAVAEGIADPERVAIMGGSYGGYATLAGLVFTPDVYACGVDIVGMSNMKTVFGSIPPYWEPFKKMMLRRVGDVEQDDELNRRISPLFHVEKIKAKLLIGQGANDPRVNVNESNQMVAAMRERQQAVTYVVYPDEGHGFARPENRLDFNGRADAFLAECLGGRSQPYEPVEGSSGEAR